jgi:hypothetical protein
MQSRKRSVKFRCIGTLSISMSYERDFVRIYNNRPLGSVVQRWDSANPGLKLNLLF